MQHSLEDHLMRLEAKRIFQDNRIMRMQFPAHYNDMLKKVNTYQHYFFICVFVLPNLCFFLFVESLFGLLASMQSSHQCLGEIADRDRIIVPEWGQSHQKHTQI